jgi:hypothetical protein
MKNLVNSRFHSFQQIPVVTVIAIAVLAWMSACKTVNSPGGSGTFAGRVVLFDSTSTMLANLSGTTPDRWHSVQHDHRFGRPMGHKRCARRSI